MRVVKRLGHGMALGLLAALAVLGTAPPARAYVPPLEDLVEQLAAGAPSASSAILDFECRVYPLPAPDAAAVQAAPDRARGFRQRVYWQRGRLLAVETLAEDGTLLHVLLDEGGFLQAAQVSPARQFSLADVRPLVFPFLEGKPAAWSHELAYWGVRPAAVDLVLTKAGQVYRLSEDEDKSLWLEKDTVRAVRLATRVDGTPAPWRLTVEFSDFTSFATRGPEKDNLRVPRRIAYAFNGALFKEVRMTGFEVDPPARKIPLARLRQQTAAATARRPQ